MKRRLQFLFMVSLVLILALVACGGGEEPTPTPEPTDLPPTSTPVPTNTPEPTEPPPTATPVPTNTPEPTATPDTSASFIDFSSDMAGLAIGYPEDWVTADLFGIILFAESEEMLDPENLDAGSINGPVAIVMSGGTEDFDSTDPVEILNLSYEDMGIAEDATLVEGPEAATYNDLPGAYAIISGTDEDGQEMTVFVAVVVADDRAAIFFGATPPDQFEDNRATFEAMLNTIALSEPVMDLGGGFDTGDMPDAAGFLIVGDVVEGVVPEGDATAWGFEASAGDTFTIVVAPTDDDLDAVVDVINIEGQSILPSGEVDEEFDTETLTVEIPEDGTYFIKIRGFAGGGGGFEITFTAGGTSSGAWIDEDDLLHQWASDAVATSEYGNPSWAAIQTTGAPDTDGCGDIVTAWASSSSSGTDTLELFYDIPVYATEINIYQTYNPDQVVSVEFITVDGDVLSIYDQEPVAEDCPYILNIYDEGGESTADLINGVRITIDQSVLGLGWNEIDAVELIGIPPEGFSLGESGESDVVIDDVTVLWRYGGESGYDEGQPGVLDGIAYDSDNDVVYVADSNNGVLVLDAATGELLDVFSTGTFAFSPSDVAIAPDGNIYVANDSFNDEEGRIVVFSPTGEVINEFGGVGTGDGEFGILSPASLAISPDGTVYVLDSNKDEAEESIMRLHEFDLDGNFLGVVVLDTEEYFISYDASMATDADGYLYIGEWIDGLILKFDSDGSIEEISRSTDFFIPSAEGIGLDAEGNIYIVVWDTPAILKLDPSGTELASYGAQTEDGDSPWPEGAFYWPNGLAVTPDGSMAFITDWSGDYTYVTAIELSE